MLMKSLFEENGGAYREENGHFLPNLALPNEAEYHIGIWGRQRLNYLKRHRRVLYVNLLSSGQLVGHLLEVDTAAHERRETIIQQMSTTQGITERLKSENQMLWIGRMNSIGACADEIIQNELIYE